jgi:hypothetical protein
LIQLSNYKFHKRRQNNGEPLLNMCVISTNATLLLQTFSEFVLYCDLYHPQWNSIGMSYVRSIKLQRIQIQGDCLTTNYICCAKENNHRMASLKSIKWKKAKKKKRGDGMIIFCYSIDFIFKSKIYEIIKPWIEISV